MGGVRMCDLCNNKQIILFMHLLTTYIYGLSITNNDKLIC